MKHNTAAAVPERSGIPRSTIGKILAGIRAIDLAELCALIRAVDTTPTVLMTAAEGRLGGKANDRRGRRGRP
ncbi:helix-turn-helix domain-containing protein [Rhodococcus sp. MTM3W5.2]|uniref:helix-turn-helix domain-containing protein n=1 Tax=Rhodococcus sp. MTM3W5.2 TaxID=1805827 RepID=UPI0011AE5D4A